IQWGVLGNATIARKCVIPAIQKSRNGNVHVLATRTLKKSHQVVSDNHIPNITDNYENVLRDPAVEAVYIPLPNHLHHPWTIKALSFGKHVLCEKPLACNAAEAMEMAAAADKSGLILMEAFMYRFHPRSQRIKQTVAAGGIGKPCLVRSTFCFHMDKQILKTAGNARLKTEMGGGALLDVGCYSVSVARWLMAAEPTRVQAQAVYGSGGVDIHVVGSLRFPDDGLANLEASFISALQQTFTVVGRTGAIELPHDAFIPWEKDAFFWLRKKDQESGKKHILAGADEYQLMIEHFNDVVLGKAEMAYPIEDSLANMRTLDALAEAARSGQTVDL
ncbi:MAG: Gfo/Idh/MocA family oxidoreductase, partial [Desulfobacterales bacterium]